MSNTNDELANPDGAKANGAARSKSTPTPYASWLYLGVIAAVFLILAIAAYASDGDSSLSAGVTRTTDGNSDPTGTNAEADLVDLSFGIESNTVTLQGAVPDMGAHDQLVGHARAVYGPENVVDELTIDADTTLLGGSIVLTGAARDGDDRPEDLLNLVSGFGGAVATMDVTFAVTTLNSVDAELEISSAGSVRLIGVVPDDASAARLIAISQEIYGLENVDASGLSVDGETTWDGGRIRLTGLVDPGDSRADDLRAVLERDNAGVEVLSEVAVDVSAEALGRIQNKLRAELAVEPILFATGRSDISPASDAILIRVAAAVSSVPGIPVEIVGHTDNEGRAVTNQELSEARANAVLERLVELGVARSRLSARGAGEDEPIASNATASGRQQNRRIEFIFQGAATGG